MNKLTILLFVMIINSFIVSAAVIIFEDFEDGADDTFPSGWTLASGSGNWDVESTGALNGSFSLQLKSTSEGAWNFMTNDISVPADYCFIMDIKMLAAKSAAGSLVRNPTGDDGYGVVWHTEPSGGDDVRPFEFSGGGISDTHAADNIGLDINSGERGVIRGCIIGTTLTFNATKGGTTVSGSMTDATYSSGSFGIIGYNLNDGRDFMVDNICVFDVSSTESDCYPDMSIVTSTLNMTSDGGCTVWVDTIIIEDLLFNDSFNRADSSILDNDWTETVEVADYNAEILGNIMKASATGSADNGGNIVRSFTKTTIEYLDFNVKTSTQIDNNANHIYGYDGATECFTIYAAVNGNDNNMVVWDGSSQTVIRSGSANVWYDFSMQNIDWSAGTFDVSVDGVLYDNSGSHFNFWNACTGGIDSIKIRTYTGDASTDLYGYWDNVSVIISRDIIHNNTCNTTDGTPTVVFDTNINADCSLRDEEGNYNASFICGTTGENSHVCTIYDEDKLSFGLSSLYASCYDGITHSVTGAMSINMTAGDGEGLRDCIKITNLACSVSFDNNCAIITLEG